MTRPSTPRPPGAQAGPAGGPPPAGTPDAAAAEAAPTAEAPAGPRRLGAFDNLRILLTVLVVVHHAALTYGNIPLWYYTEPAQDPTGGILDLVVMLNQTFFMGFFFLISGFFVPGSADRKGGRAFLRGRLLRLGVPLLLFLLLVRPLLQLPGALDGPLSALPYWLYYLVTWDPGPMWFVETLLVFSLAYLLIRRLRPRRAAAPAAPAAEQGGRFPGAGRVLGFTAVLIVLTISWRLLVPVGSYWPVVGLPTPAYLPQYVLFFAAGAVGYRRGWFHSVPRAGLWTGLGLIAFAAVAFLPLGEAYQESALAAAAVGAFDSTFSVGVVLVLLRLFQQYWPTQGAAARWVSDHAFAVYFLHAPVLSALGYALAGWDAAALAKFAVLTALALPVSWGAAAGLRSLPGARRVF
ncbi:acyltransferase family protein [Nocardiopsis coralliicola]